VYHGGDMSLQELKQHNYSFFYKTGVFCEPGCFVSMQRWMDYFSTKALDKARRFFYVELSL